MAFRRDIIWMVRLSGASTTATTPTFKHGSPRNVPVRVWARVLVGFSVAAGPTTALHILAYMYSSTVLDHLYDLTNEISWNLVVSNSLLQPASINPS